MDPLGLVGFIGIERRRGALRIAGHTAGGHQLLVIIGAIPIAGPLPDIAGHVIQSISVGSVLRHGGNPSVAVLARVGIWEVSLVRVRHPLALRTELIAPHEWLPRKPATCRKLPFCFGR